MAVRAPVGARLAACAGASLALAALLAGACNNGPPRPRNLLVITLDTMRADRLPPYGFGGVAAPALDRLAAEGVVFEQAFSPVPLTLPSHAALFTGMLPPRLAVRDNVDAPLAARFRTLAEALDASGLATAAFVASGVLAPGRGLDQGFNTYSLGTCKGAAPVRRRASGVVDEAIAWLEQHDSAPFFVWTHFYDTHRPYRIPDDDARGYADPYSAAIAFEDAQIARLVEYLEARDLFDDTLVAIVGDHGESLGDHGEDTHGIFIYQEALHVPLIFRGPGIPPGRVSAVVRLTDVTPTILDMFGIDAEPVDGASLTDLLGGKNEGSPREVYAESLYPRRFGWASLRALRADRYKVIDATRPELFDLAADPFEQRNLFDSKPAVGAALIERLRSLESSIGGGDSPPATNRAAAERIASLGYVSRPVGTTPAAASQPDPKDTIATFNELTRAQSRAVTPGGFPAACPEDAR